MIRNIAGLVAGVLTVGVVVLALQWVGARLYPLPEGLDPLDPEQQELFREYMRTLPASGWFLAFSSELLGAFAGALVAARIATSRRLWIAGGCHCRAGLGRKHLELVVLPAPHGLRRRSDRGLPGHVPDRGGAAARPRAALTDLRSRALLDSQRLRGIHRSRPQRR